jgi:hypothetical protein
MVIELIVIVSFNNPILTSNFIKLEVHILKKIKDYNMDGFEKIKHQRGMNCRKSEFRPQKVSLQHCTSGEQISCIAPCDCYELSAFLLL